MKYLVLRRFRSFGKMLERGQTVDESEIRSPRLRRSEGKIIPAVPSFTLPKEFSDDEPLSSDGIVEETDIDADESKQEEPKKPLFTFGK